MQFTDMGINPKIIRALEEDQIVSPTEIQEQCIPHGISHHKSHVIGQAKTGSGKTLAFAIPIIQQIDQYNRHVQAVVLVPTRELCKQNATVFKSIGKYRNIKIVEVYGGASMRVQTDGIRNGGQVIIATPGRLIDLVRRGEASFKHVKFVALDEADRMLDMGFLPDMQFLLLEAMRDISPRLFLFSATMMGQIRRLIGKFTQTDTVHEINVSKDSLTVSNCDQYAYPIDSNKFKSFVRILNNEKPDISIIFTKTRRHATEVCRKLNKEQRINFPFTVGFIHGDVTQAKREETIERFRNRELTCLVATNVLARGLDFPEVSHVFNYDLPRDPEDYVHRIGRTARVAGVEKVVAQGKAISIISTSQVELMRNIEKLLKYKIEKRELPRADYGTPAPRKEFVFEEGTRMAHSRNSNSNRKSKSPNNKRRNSSPKKKFGNSRPSIKSPARKSRSGRPSSSFNTRHKKSPKSARGIKESTGFTGSVRSKSKSQGKKTPDPTSTQARNPNKVHVDRRHPYYINKLNEAKARNPSSSRNGKKKPYSKSHRPRVSSPAK